MKEFSMDKKLKEEYHFRVYKHIFLLKSIWREIINEDDGEFFLTYFYNKNATKLFRLYSFFSSILKLRINKQRVRFFAGETSQGNVVFIFPAIINKNNQKIHWLGANCSNGSGYNGFILKNGIDKTFIWDCFILFLQSNYKGYSLNLIDTLKECSNNDFEVFRSCVKINLEKSQNSFDKWYSSLTKNSRQNIRTAYNRLNKDHKEYTLLLFDKLTHKQKSKLYYLFVKRGSQINQTSFDETLSLKGLIELNIKRYFNIVFYLINRSERISVAMLYIDNNISAAMIMYSESSGVLVPKLAFNTEYSKYSPGVVMISEYIKQLNTKDKPFTFDLSRGNERYKIALGGKIYYNYILDMEI